jgi:AcrR family transcriptional regulator
VSTKRDDILNAALRLFSRRGFYGTTMPELAREAGVGAGTIYRYFDSKETLVNVLYQTWKAKITEEVYADLPADLPWRARFTLLWTRLFDFTHAHPEAFAFVDLHFHSDYLNEQSRSVEQMSATTLFIMVLEGQADQVLVDLPPAVLIAMVYSAFLGVVRAEQAGYVLVDEALAAETEERAWAMIRR